MSRSRSSHFMSSETSARFGFIQGPTVLEATEEKAAACRGGKGKKAKKNLGLSNGPAQEAQDGGWGGGKEGKTAPSEKGASTRGEAGGWEGNQTTEPNIRSPRRDVKNKGREWWSQPPENCMEEQKNQFRVPASNLESKVEYGKKILVVTRLRGAMKA